MKTKLAIVFGIVISVSAPGTSEADPFTDLLVGAAKALAGPQGGDAFTDDPDESRRANDALRREMEENFRLKCAGKNTTFCAPARSAGTAGEQGGVRPEAQLKAKGPQDVPSGFTHTAAAGLPDCRDPEVHKLAIQAVYRDMRKLRLLDGPDLEMEQLINSFQNSTSHRAQLIYRSLPASYGLDESYVQVCEPPNSDVPYAIVIMNPKSRRWGVAVGDFGVPGLSAEIRLEFLAGQ